MSQQVRITLWGCPRTCSSSFLKSMSKMPGGTQVLFELYTTAWHFGPERDLTIASTFPKEPEIDTELDESGVLTPDSRSGFHSSVCNYDFCKHQMEAPYLGKRLVFDKEMASYVLPKFANLAEGYRHVFLIRDPNVVFPSWKKIVQEMRMVKHGENIALEDLILDRQPADIMPAGLGFRETYEMYQHVMAKGLDVTVIDAEDLVADPKAVLTAFCRKMGLPYSDDLLAWDAGSAVTEDWVISQRHKYILRNAKTLDVFRNSTGFHKPDHDESSYAKMTEDVKRCVEVSMPYYQKMYEDRLKVELHSPNH